MKINLNNKFCKLILLCIIYLCSCSNPDKTNTFSLIFAVSFKMVFTFADILFGSDSEEFVAVNHIVGNTIPNTLKIIGKRLPTGDDFVVPTSLSPYFYRDTLLPFDLLIGRADRGSLFQINLKVLLEQRLQIPERSNG